MFLQTDFVNMAIGVYTFFTQTEALGLFVILCLGVILLKTGKREKMETVRAFLGERFLSYTQSVISTSVDGYSGAFYFNLNKKTESILVLGWYISGVFVPRNWASSPIGIELIRSTIILDNPRPLLTNNLKIYDSYPGPIKLFTGDIPKLRLKDYNRARAAETRKTCL